MKKRSPVTGAADPKFHGWDAPTSGMTSTTRLFPSEERMPELQYIVTRKEETHEPHTTRIHEHCDRRTGRGGRYAPSLRPMAAERTLSRPRRRSSRSKLCKISARSGRCRAARHGDAVVRGARLVRRRSLPAMERHSQQP